MNRNLLYIGDVGSEEFQLMPALRSYKVDRQDIDSSDSGRSETGHMYRNRVRKNVYKLFLTWRIPDSKQKQIVDAIDSEAFLVKFYDPNTCSEQTCTMYAGDRSSTMIKNDDEPNETWWDFSVNFIEY